MKHEKMSLFVDLLLLERLSISMCYSVGHQNDFQQLKD